jgi:hypothetical protein
MIFAVAVSGAWSFGAAEREHDVPSTSRKDAIATNGLVKVEVFIGPSIRAARLAPQDLTMDKATGFTG